jgi:hypothetical protein
VPSAKGFSLTEIKATRTISTALFKELDRFEEIAVPAQVTKTLVYGGTEDQERTKYKILSWKNISG